MNLELPARPRTADFKSRTFTPAEIRFLASKTSLVGVRFTDCPIGDKEVRALSRLPHLCNVILEGTRVTDGALKHLAAMPELYLLSLDRTRITGTGFRYFANHPSLGVIWVNGTRITDRTLPLLVKVPNLSTLCIKSTKVSFRGVLQLASHPRIKVVARKSINAKQMSEFEALQRRQASDAKPVSPEALKSASRVLRGFFAAMTAWEKEMIRKENHSHPRGKNVEKKMMGKCAEIFKNFCTVKHRSYSRPNVMYYGGSFDGEKIVDAEQPAPHRIVIYTKSTSFRYRYFLFYTKGEWRLDHKEDFQSGWKRSYL